MIILEKIRRISEKLTGFLRRKREQKRTEFSRQIRRELESMLKDHKYRRLIQDITRTK